MTGPQNWNAPPRGWTPPPVPPPRYQVGRPVQSPPTRSRAQRVPDQSWSAPAHTGASGRSLYVAGGACVAVSVLSVILRLAGVLPSGWATAVVVAVTAIGLRIFIRFTGRSASTVHRARIAKFVALGGLAVSMITLFVSLPVLLRGGGSDHFVENVFAHLWTVAILIAIAGTARTLNWMAFLGMGLTGFLAVTGIAFAIGRPVVEALGDDSVFASAFYVPFTEEVLKALPAVLILVLAARQLRTRPSALELGPARGGARCRLRPVRGHPVPPRWLQLHRDADRIACSTRRRSTTAPGSTSTTSARDT